MSLLWEVLVGLLWQFDYFFNQLGSDLPLPGQVALGSLGAAAGLYTVWQLGGREIQAATSSMILICVIATPVLLLGAGQPILAWAVCLPVCAAAMWTGNTESLKSRWHARGLWAIAFLSPALILDSGPSAALILSLFAWTVGWTMRRMPLQQKSWQLPAPAKGKSNSGDLG